MTCRNPCGHQFCWVCSAEWSNPHFLCKEAPLPPAPKIVPVLESDPERRTKFISFYGRFKQFESLVRRIDLANSLRTDQENTTLKDLAQLVCAAVIASFYFDDNLMNFYLNELSAKLLAVDSTGGPVYSNQVFDCVPLIGRLLKERLCEVARVYAARRLENQFDRDEETEAMWLVLQHEEFEEAEMLELCGYYE